MSHLPLFLENMYNNINFNGKRPKNAEAVSRHVFTHLTTIFHLAKFNEVFSSIEEFNKLSLYGFMKLTTVKNKIANFEYERTYIQPLSEILADQKLLNTFGISLVIQSNGDKTYFINNEVVSKDWVIEHLRDSEKKRRSKLTNVKLELDLQVNGIVINYTFIVDLSTQHVTVLKNSNIIVDNGRLNFDPTIQSLANDFISTHTYSVKHIRMVNNYLKQKDFIAKLDAQGVFPTLTLPGTVIAKEDSELGTIVTVRTLPNPNGDFIKLLYKPDMESIALIRDKTTKKLISARIPLLSNFDENVEGGKILTLRPLQWELFATIFKHLTLKPVAGLKEREYGI